MLNKLKLKSEFSKNVLTLMTGTTIAQAIPIAISPILTRIYTPEDFGVLALFVAITAIFGSIANGRYELAIMLPKKDEDAINIFALGFIITSCMSLLLLILVVVFNDNLTTLLGNKDISFWLYFVPISVFFTGLFNILNYFNNRRKNYKDLRNATILKSIVLAIIQLIVGFVKSGATGLVTGSLISNMFANMKLLKNILKDNLLISNISKLKIIALSRRYKKFPKFDIFSTLSNTLSSQLPIILLSSFFNSTVTGFYSLSLRILVLPMSLIGSSIGQVFLQQSSTKKNDLIFLKKLTKNTFIKLFIIGFIPISIVGVYGDYIFTFVFGTNWTIAGQYAQILSIWIFFVFVMSPLSTLFITLEKQKIFFIFNISILIARILAFLIGYYIFNNAFQTILLYSLVGTLFWLWLMLYIFKLVNILLKEIFMLFILLIIVLSILIFIRIFLGV